VSNAEEGAWVLAEREAQKQGDDSEKGVGAGAGVLHFELVRPIVVDWNNGRVVVGGSEEEVRKLVETLPHE